MMHSTTCAHTRTISATIQYIIGFVPQPRHLWQGVVSNVSAAQTLRRSIDPAIAADLSAIFRRSGRVDLAAANFTGRNLTGARFLCHRLLPPHPLTEILSLSLASPIHTTTVFPCRTAKVSTLATSRSLFLVGRFAVARRAAIPIRSLWPVPA